MISQSPSFSRVFSSQTRSGYLSLFSLSFIFTLLSAWRAKFSTQQVLFFLQGLVVRLRLGCLFASQNPRELSVSHSTWRILCSARSNLNFLHNSQSITFPTQSCRVLYSSCANLPHSLIMWLIASSLSPHNLHSLFCCICSIFT